MRLIFVLLFFSLVGFSHAQDEISELELSFQQANKLMVEFEYEEAIQLYNKCLEEYESAQLHHNIGIAYYLNGETGLAVFHLEAANRLSLANASTHEVLSLIRRSESLSNPNYSALHQMVSTFPEWFWMILVAAGFWGMLVFGVLLFFLYKKKSVFRDMAVVCSIILLVGVIASVGLNEDSIVGVLIGEKNHLQVIPTEGGESFMALKGGEMAKLIKENNGFVFIETNTKVRGWVPESQFRLIR